MNRNAELMQRYCGALALTHYAKAGAAMIEGDDKLYSAHKCTANMYRDAAKAWKQVRYTLCNTCEPEVTYETTTGLFGGIDDDGVPN